MPDSDLILNVRQIAGYPNAGSTGPSDSVLIQQGGLGGPYASITPSALVETALSTGGVMSIAGVLQAQTVNGGSASFSNAAINLLSVPQTATVGVLEAAFGSINGVPIATTSDLAALRASVVTSVNGRKGDIELTVWDVRGAAPIHSPRFTGQPFAPTPSPSSCSNRLATTAFVHGSVVSYINSLLQTQLVTTFNGRSGAVVLTVEDIPPLPYAPIDSPAFSGLPSAPTAPPGSASGQLATCAFVMNAVSDSTTGVVSFNTRTGVVTLLAADITAAGGALLLSPVFSGSPQAPTASPGTSSQQIASTAFVGAAIAGAGYAPLLSPQFVGVPMAPTAAVNANTTQLATCAFVMNQLSAIDAGVTTFNGRSGAVSLIGNDVSEAGGALLNSPVFTGVPTAPTAAPSTSTGQLATCAFVMAALGAASFVSTFNGRSGAVTLSLADVTAAFPASAANPLMNAGTATPGTANAWSRGDHVHPTDASRFPVAGGTMTGALTVPALAVNGQITATQTQGVAYGGSTGIAFQFVQVGSVTVFYPYSNGVQQFNLVEGYGVGNSAPVSSIGFVTASSVGLLNMVNGSQVTFPVTASDRKLKTRIINATLSGIETARLLIVHEYDMAGRHWDFGLIADEVEPVVPSAFIPAPSERGHQGLHDKPLVAMLIKAVQELTARLETLEARMA